MRKIEKAMNQAVRDSKNWCSGNTQVVTEGYISKVYLHGNLIAKVGLESIQLFDGGWQTVTTKSRLNALLHSFGDDGFRVYQRKFEWFVGDGNLEFEFKNGIQFGEEPTSDELGVDPAYCA